MSDVAVKHRARRVNLVIRMTWDEREELKADARALDFETVSDYVRSLFRAARRQRRPAAVLLGDGRELELRDE